MHFRRVSEYLQRDGFIRVSNARQDNPNIGGNIQPIVIYGKICFDLIICIDTNYIDAWTSPWNISLLTSTISQWDKQASRLD